MAKYYVTKWWQTQGILIGKGPVTTSDDKKRRYIYCRSSVVKLDVDAFDTLEAAIENVKKRAAAKVKSLQKEMALVEEMAKGREIKVP
jgi:hypothetical protein